MDIKLTNGKKTIIRSKIQYEANIAHFKMRGFTPLDEVKKEIKKATVKDITDKVIFNLSATISKFFNSGLNFSFFLLLQER